MHTNMNNFGDEDLNAVLLGSIPKHKDLCYLLGTIGVFENNGSNICNKAYQCQIYKCRRLIFTVPDVIASPVLGAVQHIHIITSMDYYLSGKLNPHLEKISIKVLDPIPLNNAIYETCLRYTILARLAPSWNQVERYLVHGREFLLTSTPLDAVKLDIVINESDMHIVLWPMRLRLPQVCAQDLQMSAFNTPFSCDLSSNNLSVHVLPSLNQASVLMVSCHIPQNSLFKSYKDLRRHWKNSYGYRLPESEEGMIYVTVRFGKWFLESLTYPIMCVRAQRPVFFRQREPQRVLMEMLADLHAKVPYICGFSFGVDATIRYAVPKLNSLSEALFPVNLSEMRPELKRRKYDVEDTPLTENPSQPVSQYTQTQPNKEPIASSFKSKHLPPFPLFCSNTSSSCFNTTRGEKTLLHLPENVGKKVRNKPQVQEGVDVKALAHTKDGLAKVNTTTLIAYLRSEGVPCKVKDKKGELVAKVMAHLNLSLPQSIDKH